MPERIHPYEREGAWSSPHRSYYEWAWIEYWNYIDQLAALKNRETELHESHNNEDPELLISLVHHETDALWDSCYKSAISAHMFACMALEGFLNNYGVRRLGEEFYKRRIERLGITEKFAILVLSCHGLVLEESAPVLLNMRQLFDHRNNLVHPKTREFDSRSIHNHVVKHPSEVPIRDNMNLMECVIAEICQLNSDIQRDSEFVKPNKAFNADRREAARPSAG